MTDAATQPKNDLAFPRLTPEQLERIAAVGACRRCDEACTLINVGDREFKFFVVQDGRVRIVEPTDKGETAVAEHGPGEFTGDIDMLTGRPSVFTAVADPGTMVLEITAEQLRELLSADSELSDIILRAFLTRRELLQKSDEFQGTRIIGSRWSKDTFRLKDFLSKHQVLHRWLDLEHDRDTDEILRRFGVSPEDTPVVICRGRLFRNPTNERLGDCLGLTEDVDEKFYDLVVVGGGPAGLATAVYGASEGLSTLVIDAVAPGGQAATSSKIENYLGFPTGISGGDLAQAAVIQAKKFQATITSPRRALDIACEGQTKCLTLDSEERVHARTIVIATGADYRRLDDIGCDRLEGKGVYYGATQMEAALCRDCPVIVVGGGNSAGQAAVFLSGVAKHVYMLIRGESLAATMSRYLIDRIERTDNITLWNHTRITELKGEEKLDAVALTSDRDDVPGELQVAAVFVMIGAVPRTEWLKDKLILDNKGFIVTGQDLQRHAEFKKNWRAGREPYHMETSLPGVFAVGDARSGSVKRVASAVGEGSMAVSFVHSVLAE